MVRRQRRWIRLPQLPWVGSGSGAQPVQLLPEHGPHTARAHVGPQPQPQPRKGRTRELTGAGGEPCRNQSHSPPADVTGPRDLTCTPHPGSAGLLRHLGLLCFLSPGPRHCLVCSTYSPAQRHFSWKASKRGSNESNCFPLSPNLSRRQVWARCAIPKEKKTPFPMKFVPATAPQNPFTPPP